MKQFLPSFHARLADVRRWEVWDHGGRFCAPKVAAFLKAQGTGTSEKPQGLKFKLSKYLIVHVSI